MELALEAGAQDAIVVAMCEAAGRRWRLTFKFGPGKTEITVERKLQASQIALRQMENPIEYTSPHAHKMRAKA